MSQCRECGAEWKGVSTELGGFTVPGVKCECEGGAFFDPEASQLVLAHNKFKGQVFESEVVDASPGGAVYIPGELAESLGLGFGLPVRVRSLGPGRLEVIVREFEGEEV